MADWIRMRSSLPTNPRVVKMARVLLAEQRFMDWFRPGAEPVTRDVTRDERDEQRDISAVTRIVVGTLLTVWSMGNEAAGRDGVIRHATSRDIDLTAGVPCFAKALEAVDWLEVLPNDAGVRFINFEEHNSPQKERSLTSKTGADRQREYRERKKREAEESASRDAEGDGQRDVTVTSHGDGREEKSREETYVSNAPNKSPRKPAGSKRVPASFLVTSDLEAWATENAPLIDWRRETEKFRDWEFKTARTDWAATWRTWMRKAQESAAERGVTARGSSHDFLAGAI